jgi:hypothetical protein
MNKLKRTIVAVLDNREGHALLKMLKEIYVDQSALDLEPHRMAYKLGQKELIQALIADLQRDEEIEQVETNQFDI